MLLFLTVHGVEGQVLNPQLRYKALGTGGVRVVL